MLASVAKTVAESNEEDDVSSWEIEETLKSGRRLFARYQSREGA